MSDVAAVTRPRLASQFLTTPGPRRASDVVRALLAVQAQDYPGAKWALGMRARDIVDADVEAELNAGKILRTHVMRPTWHFVAPEDIRWLLALTAPRVAAVMASYNRKFELTPSVFRRTNDTIARAVEGGQHLTRAELKARLGPLRIGVVNPQRMAHIMMQAELDAVVCSGARRGSQFTYALLDERAPPTRTLDRDEALDTIARRYFATRGPASVQDFSWWSGLRMADARRAIGIAGTALERVDIASRTMWSGAAPGRRATTRASAHLLPNYDEYFIGFRDRSAFGHRIGSVAAVTGGSALINHIAIVDGQIVGGWKRLQEGASVVVDMQLLTRLTTTERSRLSRAGRRLERYLGVPVEERVRY